MKPITNIGFENAVPNAAPSQFLINTRAQVKDVKQYYIWLLPQDEICGMVAVDANGGAVCISAGYSLRIIPQTKKFDLVGAVQQITGNLSLGQTAKGCVCGPPQQEFKQASITTVIGAPAFQKLIGALEQHRNNLKTLVVFKGASPAQKEIINTRLQQKNLLQRNGVELTLSETVSKELTSIVFFDFTGEEILKSDAQDRRVCTHIKVKAEQEELQMRIKVLVHPEQQIETDRIKTRLTEGYLSDDSFLDSLAVLLMNSAIASKTKEDINSTLQKIIRETLTQAQGK